MKNSYIMTDNQIRICKNTLESLKTLCDENNHFYTPMDVYYKPSGKQLKKWVLLTCNEHRGESFEQDIQDVKIFRRSKKCPDCFSIIQRNNIRVPISELMKRIRECKNLTIRNNQNVIRYANHLHNDINSLVEVKCNLFGHHKNTYLQTAVSIGKTNVCPECSKIRDWKKAGLDLVEKINSILTENNQNFTFDGTIERDNKGIIFYNLKCKSCDCSEWEREKYVKSVKCKVCFPNDTKGESRIIEYLRGSKIQFEKQKKLIGLKNILDLKLDFFLPKHNMIIEFDGHLHYYPVDYFKGFKSFEKLLKCDWIKNRFAFKNRINILRIPYYKIDNIENILDEAIKKLKNGEKIHKISYLPLIVKRRKSYGKFKK